jgi:two-component system NarL family sensor kinase
MDAATRLTERAEERTAVRSEGHVESAPADDGGRSRLDQRSLADGLLKILESDRAHVADVLGGEIVSVMTMARYLIEDATQRLARGDFEDLSEELRNASAQIRAASQQLVALCSELRPQMLDDLGLLAALSGHFRDFSHENRAIFVSPRITVTEADVPAALKVVLFRIVQAALNNVARHSKASTARVFLSLVDGELRLGIEDNGIGFDADRWLHRRTGQEGCGLGMILRWAEISGGRCSIEATPRHGARVLVTWRVQSTAAPAGPERMEPGASRVAAGA